MTVLDDDFETELQRKRYALHNDITEVREQRNAALACLSILLSEQPIGEGVMQLIIDFEKEPFARAHTTANALFVLGYEVHFGDE